MNALIIALVVIGIVILILVFGYLYVGNYFYDIAINPNSDKSALEIGEITEEEKAQRIEWLKNNSKDTYITSTNNGKLKLHAYEIEANEKSNIWTIVVHGYTLYEASSLEQIKKSQTRTLFIHGSADTFVPYNMLDTLYNTAKCEKEKLVIEGAEHAVSVEVNPELYWKTIDNFIEKYI